MDRDKKYFYTQGNQLDAWKRIPFDKIETTNDLEILQRILDMQRGREDRKDRSSWVGMGPDAQTMHVLGWLKNNSAEDAARDFAAKTKGVGYQGESDRDVSNALRREAISDSNDQSRGIAMARRPSGFEPIIAPTGQILNEEDDYQRAIARRIQEMSDLSRALSEHSLLRRMK